MPLPRTPPLFPYTTLFRSSVIAEPLQPAHSGLEPFDGRGAGYAGSADFEGIGEHAHAAAFAKPDGRDRKSTRLNSSHSSTSYAGFCLKNKRRITPTWPLRP